MSLLDRIKDYLEYPLHPGDKPEIEALFTDDVYPALVKMGGVIMMFEAFMIISTLARGGPWPTLRSQLYFWLYVTLFCVTGVFFTAIVYLHRKRRGCVACQLRLSVGYSVILCLWSCFVTLLDQHAGPNLTVYSYVLMAMAVFCMFRPWQSLLVFGGGFLFLNCAAVIFRYSDVFFSSVPDMNNMLINSLFVTILTIAISNTLYRYRVMKKHDSTLIQKQYDQIRIINQQLNDLAMTDQLTGLGNRRYLEDRMKQLREQSPQSNMAGMLLDIDFFKQYNDTYGHQAGDSCLQRLAEIMQCFAGKENAVLARYGGEEFFLCLTGCSDAAAKAEELRRTIEDGGLLREDVPSGRLTVSIGVAVEKECGAAVWDKFLNRCDEALYEAKNTGRNKICIFPELPVKGIM